MFNKLNYGRSTTVSSTSDAILNRINATKLNINETSINSAALQDHIMQSYNLGSLDPFRQKPKVFKKPPYMAKYDKNRPGMSSRALSNAGQNIIRTDSANSSLSVPKSGAGIQRRQPGYSNSRPRAMHEESKIPTQSNQVYKTKNLIDKLNTETYINIEKKREEYVSK